MPAPEGSRWVARSAAGTDSPALVAPFLDAAVERRRLGAEQLAHAVHDALADFHGIERSGEQAHHVAQALGRALSPLRGLEEPRVLDRDGGLLGERGEEANLPSARVTMNTPRGDLMRPQNRGSHRVKNTRIGPHNGPIPEFGCV